MYKRVEELAELPLKSAVSHSRAATTHLVSTAQCDYDKQRKVLTLSSRVIGMPHTFHVRSHYTGKIVMFVAVQPGDSLFDEDGWDGEQCVYRPSVAVPNVDHMVIYNH
jgi:hypothetical protein